MANILFVVLGAALSAAPMWNTSYNDALTEAKQQDRPLFILFAGDPTTIVTRSASGFPVLRDSIDTALSADYVRLYVDTGTTSGRALVEQFGAAELPLTVIIDRSGEWQVYRRSGVPTTGELLAALTEYRRAQSRPLVTKEASPSPSSPPISAQTPARVCRS